MFEVISQYCKCLVAGGELEHTLRTPVEVLLPCRLKQISFVRNEPLTIRGERSRCKKGTQYAERWFDFDDRQATVAEFHK